MIYGGLFDPNQKNKRVEELSSVMEDSNFWNDKQNSEKVINEINLLKNLLNNVYNLKLKIENNLSTLKELKQNYDSELKELIEEEKDELIQNMENLEINVLLNKEYDKLNAIVDIHSGAGGTEACDWANMLYRMYSRWCEKNGYKIEIVDTQPGEEVGIKSLSMIVKGINAYGYLKVEKGVHRLVRISPFDSNARRHTSFASINVTPVFENNKINVEIKDSDIRIDVYRSSGCGGQGVNTTDSAVRITHIPTKIVVTCQNERSQIKNKEIALSILKNKLYNLELEKKNNELKDISGNVSDINFGSQIRSYVMQPYKLVKDNRTGTEVSDVDAVLDGDIDKFIYDNLKKGV